MRRLGSARRSTHVLVVAKAPIAGFAKTRLAATLGDTVAAHIAATCLLDTIDAVESITQPRDRLIALTGALADAEGDGDIRERLRNWQVMGQHGETFADRLVNAHADAATLWGANAVIVQIGMDTPQVTGADLLALADAVTRHGVANVRVAVGPAADGGWWGLASSAAGQRRPGRCTNVAPRHARAHRSGAAVNRCWRHRGARAERRRHDR